MKPIELVLCLVSLWALKGFAGETPRSGSSPGAENLLAQQLAQAKNIKSSAQGPAADQALEKLKNQIAAKKQLWQQRLAQAHGVAALLEGIPQPILERAKKMAADPAQVRAELKQGVNLPLLMALTAERNPEVSVAYQNWQASVQQFDQAGYLEDLLLQYRAFVRELDTGVGPQKHRPMLGVYPSALSLKGEIVDLSVEIAWLNYLLTLRKAVNEAAKMYFEIQYSQSALAIMLESRTLFDQMAKSARSQLEAGAVGQADVLKADNELVLISNKVLTVERGRMNSIAQVNTLLALSPGSEWGPVAALNLPDQSPPLAAALKEAQDKNQELLAARNDVELMRLMLRMAQVEITPQASSGYSQFAPSTGAEAGPTRSMMAVFPEKQEVSGSEAAMFSSNAAYLSELAVRVSQTVQMAEMVAYRIEFAVQDADFRVDKSRRDRQTYAHIVVPQALQAYQALQERYSNNAVPLIEFLDAGRSYLENSLLLEEARMNFNQAQVDLLDAMGRSALNGQAALQSR